MTMHTRDQSAGEELANSLTHGIGLILSIACLVLLVVFSALNGTVWHIVSCSIYGLTLVILYAASTLMHAVRTPRLKRAFKIMDHSAIYTLIAGTYTPFTLVVLRDHGGWWVFGAVWSLALAGIIYQVLFVDRYQIVSLLSYLALGWLVVFVIKPLMATLPPAGLVWIFLGGLAYTIGTIFFASSRPYFHAVWHVFVLIGSLCHFFGILFYVIL